MRHTFNKVEKVFFFTLLYFIYKAIVLFTFKKIHEIFRKKNNNKVGLYLKIQLTFQKSKPQENSIRA